MRAYLKNQNVVLSVVSITSPQHLETSIQSEPTGAIYAAMMPCPKNAGEPLYYCFPKTNGLPDIDWLRGKIESEHICAFHEMMFNYDGSLPSAEKMAPYWALAAEFDLPIGVHAWSGPPPGASIRKDPELLPKL